MSSNYFPTGTLHVFHEQFVPALLASGEWLVADGLRLRRHEDPVLYDLLRPTFRRRWRRWIVHVPNMTKGAPFMMMIRTSKRSAA